MGVVINLAEYRALLAVPVVERCERCAGEGLIADEKELVAECPDCEGSGHRG